MDKGKSVEVDYKLLQSTLYWIEMQVAIRHKKFHDQDSLVEDIQKLIDDGHMPVLYYKLKGLL